MQVSQNITEICSSFLICLSIVSQYVPIKLCKRCFSKNFKIKSKIQSFHDHLERQMRERGWEGESFWMISHVNWVHKSDWMYDTNMLSEWCSQNLHSSGILHSITGSLLPTFLRPHIQQQRHYPGEWRSQQFLSLISSVCDGTDQSSLQGITLLLCIDVAHLVKKTSNSKYRVCVMGFL